ncbi:O-antigen ligase family protein [Clostridium estertheticum]|nr:O-antigen ligase family protein [Clostridium estertheticum]
MITKKVVITKALGMYSIIMVMFIIYTFLFYYVDIIYYGDIFKSAAKYMCIFILTVFSYLKLKDNRQKFYVFLIGFAISDFLVKAFLINMNNKYWLLSMFSTSTLHVANFLLPLLLLMQIKKIKSHYKILLIIGLLVSIYCMSRTSIVTSCVVYIYILYVGNNNKNIERKYKLIITCFKYVAIFILLLLFVNVMSRELSQVTASNIERTNLLNAAIEIIKTNLIFGVGPVNFARYSYEILRIPFQSNIAVHNYFLDVWVNWGSIGFILIMMPFIKPIRAIIGYRESVEMSAVLFIYFIIVLMFNVVSGDFRIIFSFLMANALIVGEDLVKKNNTLSVNVIKE